ncbi:MAG: hypothetical protein ACRD3V_07825, partial [Vicinamibacteria bacterium]
MNAVYISIVAMAMAAFPLGLARAEEAAITSYEMQNALLGDYCVMCHSDEAKTAGLTLESFDVSRAEENAPIAEKMIRKLRAGMMP